MSEATNPAVVRQWRLAGVALLLSAAGALVGSRYGLWQGLGGTIFVLGAGVAPWGLYGVRLRPHPSDLLWGVGTGALLVVATHVLYLPVTAWFPWVGSDVGRLYAAFSALRPGLAALLLPPIILCEELIWRGLMQGALAQRLPVGASVLGTALLYGAAQVPTGSPTLVVVSFACGLVWSGLRARTGSLLPAVLSHLLWDGVVLLLWPPL